MVIIGSMVLGSLKYKEISIWEKILIKEENVRWLLVVIILYTIYKETFHKGRNSIDRSTSPKVLYDSSIYIIAYILFSNDWVNIYIGLETYTIIIYIIMLVEAEKYRSNVIIKYVLSSIIVSISLIGYIGYKYYKINDQRIGISYDEDSSYIMLLPVILFKLGLFPFNYYVNTVYSVLNQNTLFYILIINKSLYLYLLWFIMNIYSVWDSMRVIIIISVGIHSIIGMNSINLKNILINSSIVNLALIILFINTNNILLVLFAYNMIIIVIYSLNLNNYLNLARSQLWLLMIIAIFSIIGLPPTINFYIKYNLIKDYISQPIIVTTIILSSIVTTVYYLYLIFYNNYNYQPKRPLGITPIEVTTACGISYVVTLYFIPEIVSLTIS